MLKQGLQQKLLQKLSPQQIQLMKLLQIPTVALEQRIKEEIQNNPALEEGKEEEEDTEKAQDELAEDSFEEQSDYEKEDIDISEYIQDDDVPFYKTAVNNSSPDDERGGAIPVAVSTSFHDTLYAQIGLYPLGDKEQLIAQQIIGSIDDDGYLRRPLQNLADDLAFSGDILTNEEELLYVLKVIQSFDPPGVGARTLQECLMLQLQRKDINNPYVARAMRIVKDYMEEFSRKHYDKIEKQLSISHDELKNTIHEILRLNPKPGSSFSDNQKSTQHVIPDFILINNDGIFELSLNSKNAPDLRISRSYKEMLESYANDKSNKEAVLFVKQKLDSAKWFIDAIRQRQDTLLLTMKAILDYQYDYFLEGDETKLKPMILKDIADRIGLDISTVSRVANSKYVQTPFGTFLLKSFFSEGLQTDSGEEVSSREVKKIMSDCIAAEDKRKPLTDDKIAEILREKGYNIARRTIAKYREQLNIPVARLRKEL